MTILLEDRYYDYDFEYRKVVTSNRNLNKLPSSDGR